jgi:GYF domain 2
MGIERKYFININGNNLGPLKFEEIGERLVNGLLTCDDYIFIMGDSNWKFIRDLEEFKAHIKPLTEPESNKVWYVRKNKKNAGPFSTLDVTKMLESGQIDLNDYSWKKGLKSWITLKETGEFMLEATATKEKIEQQKEETPKPKTTSALEMIRPPDEQNYIKPKKKRLMPELILGLILFCVGILEFKNNELIGGLIAISGLAVIIIFLRIRKK